jgi:pimeloyl-ACP methyl ester carboxylesterase
MAYRVHDIPVDGGTLRVGHWGPADADSSVATVIAVHGITASHLAWAVVAHALPQVALIAPDLRGRGRSNELPGPFGMARHASDLQAVSEVLGLPPAILVGHSMGGFVAVVAAHRYPDRFKDVLLVDGGLPLEAPAGVSGQELLEVTLGPALRRLSMTFPDRQTYREFWRQHPAFGADHWSQAVADYVDYDLVGTEPSLRSSASLEAVRADSIDQFGGGVVQTALAARSQSPPPQGRSLTLLTAPRGLLNQTPGLYSPQQIERWRAELPAMRVRQVPDVNHYSIVLGEAGAGAVADEVMRLINH